MAAAERAKEEEEEAAAEKRAAAVAARGEGEGEEEEEDPNAMERAKFDEFVAHLYTCQSRDLIDKAAEKFCYLNNKLNRRKLARALFQVPRANHALLPYLARFVAVLNPAMDDVAPQLADMLYGEFRAFSRHRTEGMMESKLRNVRFQAELFKFKLIRPFTIFNVWQTFIDDFAFQNIELSCNLLEVCGRFLYRTLNTHERTHNMLAAMLRLKAHKNLDSRFNNMIENAYYVCRPPEQSARAKRKLRDPVHEYIRHLIFTKLSKASLEGIKKQLRKLDWKVHEPYLVKCMLKVQKMKYNQVYLIASLTAGLTRYHNTLPIHLTDDLLSEVRHLLHTHEFAKQQRLLSLVKLLGELYNDLVVDSPIIFDMLYTFISAGNDRVGPMPDPPADFSRVRLVCALLDTCGHYFDRGTTKKKLDVFIAHFQRYLLGKDPMPMDVDFLVSDMLEAVGPQLKRVDTIEAAEEYVAKLEAEHKFSKARGTNSEMTHF
jgi:regulator of nonsense transcripts 2